MKLKELLKGRKQDDEAMSCALCGEGKDEMLARTGVALLARNSATGNAICSECFDAIAPAMLKAKMDTGLMGTGMAIPLTGNLAETMDRLKAAIMSAAEGVSNAEGPDDCECEACTARRAFQSSMLKTSPSKLH